MEDGSVKGLPGGHKGPEHSTDLVVANRQPSMIFSRQVAAVKGEIQPKLCFFGLAKGVIEAVLEDSLMPPFGETLNDITAY